MNIRLTLAGVALLATSLAAPCTFAASKAAPVKKQTSAKKTKAQTPSVEEQIKALRSEMQTQIDGLKNSLAEKDALLKQAQQTAVDAQSAATQAQQAATAQQQAVTENSSAVNTLQSTVSDMREVNSSVISSLTDETATIRKNLAEPDAIHYKGVTISPSGSFLAAETVWRSAATAGDINTAFTGIPLQHSSAAQMSEFFGSGRQSRLALKAVGKTDWGTLSGYYELDWLSAGATSNNNQSNSYTMRQRQLWADVKLNNGWDFSGGQGWSLAAETTAGLTRGTEILPAAIDAQYTAGFVWARQWSFRASKNIGKKVYVGIAVENPETLNPGGQNLPTNILIGSGGTGGGLYNSAANYSFNYSPDFIYKVAVEPGWGHWEAFGITRTFRDRIYPTSGNPYNDVKVGFGGGGGFRGPVFNKKVSLGLKGLFGNGVGRYGDSTLGDITLRPDGTIEPLTGFSALSTVEINPNPRLSIYFNYGGDYLYRDYVISGANQVGYGTRSVTMSGCNTEPASTAANPSSDPTTPTNCSANNKDVQEFSSGYWYNLYNGAHGRLRQGIQYSYIRRDLWSGAGGTTNPGGSAFGAANMVFTSLRYYLP